MGKSRGAAEEPLLPPPGDKPYLRCLSHAGDELHSFRWCLAWMCVDQSGPCRAVLSWSLFLLLAVAVPAASHFLLLSRSPHRLPYDAAVQLSLTAAAVLAFIRLSAFLRRYGLRRLLFLDTLRSESDRVRREYAAQMSRSIRLLSYFALPCFAAEIGYKIWWYTAGAGRIPFLPAGGVAVVCVLEVASWIYRTTAFLVVCVLFRLICHLQILRLQDFASVFREESDVEAVLRGHLRIRRQLRVISHRFRSFILTALIIVTASQLVALLLTTRPHAEVSLGNGGELALCSIGIVAGLLICLHSAAKITHKAQALTSHAAKWHVCSTIESYEMDPETPSAASSDHVVVPVCVGDEAEYSGDDDEAESDELENSDILQPHANTISFQKRQALVTYLENNMAGITVFGFVLDRGWLHTIFMLELSLVLWLLGKTIGIS